MSDERGNLTDKELQFGYWWVEHRLKVKAGMISFVILLLVATYANVGIKFYKYLQGTAAHQQMIYELSTDSIDYQAIKAVTGPRKIRVVSAKVLPNSSNTIDIVAEVENMNNKWYLREINYQFEVGGMLTPSQTTYLLPGQKKYLYYFNFDFGDKNSSARLVLGREVWNKVKGSSHFDARKQFISPDVSVENIIYNQGGTKNDEVKKSYVIFDLYNLSSYNFWEMNAQVILWQGNKIAGFNIIGLDDVMPNEQREIFVYWDRLLALGLRPEVIIDVNHLEKSNIRTYQDIDPSFIR